MNYFRILITSLFCALILPANAQDKDCFADLESELSYILKKKLQILKNIKDRIKIVKNTEKSC